MYHVAIDLGASGGKVLAGTLSGGTLDIGIVDQFDNRPVEQDGRYVWDIDGLVDAVADGIEAADSEIGRIGSIGIDTWGVDFGLYADGDLLRDPYSYRDPDHSQALDDILATVSKREIFDATGINHWNVPNTLWQYHALVTDEPDLFEKTETIAMMPQVVGERFGDGVATESTMASTTQMLDAQTRTWATGLLDDLALPMAPLPEIEAVGTTTGTLTDDAPVDVDGTPEFVLPASHDTAAAVAGLPLSDGNRTFLSTGSWFIAGVEAPDPILSDEAFDFGASNELGVDGTTRFLKNVNGFFILEECRTNWQQRNMEYDYNTLVQRAKSAPRNGPLIDPDSDLVTIEGDMTENIAQYCTETGQEAPSGEGETARCIFESLAVKTAMTVERIERIADIDSEVLYVGGGGVRNELFLKMLASALDRRVRTGPVETTGVGNILTQAEASSEISDLTEGRRIIEQSIDVREYEPDDVGYWERRRATLQRLLERTDQSALLQ